MTEIEALMNEHIRTLKPYSTARDDFKGKADILLDANESWLGGSGINRYPDPRCTALRKELEKVLSLPFDMTAVTNGSDEAIDLLIRIFCRPGIDSVMIERPTYGAYRVFADLNGVEVIDARLKEDYTLDIPRMEEAIDERKPKIVFICSPNNPTGSLYSKEDILRIADVRDIQVLGNLRTDLSRVAVDGLTARDDQIIGQLLDAGSNRGGSGQRIGTAERSVGDQNGFIGTHSKRLAQRRVGLRRTHGNDRDMSAKLILQAKSSLKASLIVGVNDAGNTVTNQGAGYRIQLNLVCIRNLLNANYNIQRMSLLLGFTAIIISGYCRR